MIIPWLIVAFTVVTVMFLEKVESKYIKSILDWIPAILLAYIIPALISWSFSLDFSQHSIHELSKEYFIPLAIIAVMSSLSIKQLKAIGWKPIALFVSGSFWIAIFPVLFIFFLLDTNLVSEVLIEMENWKGIPPVVGSWIGGSTSQLVLKELVNCPEAIFLSILVMDNILVNIWTIIMFQGIKKSNFINKILKINNNEMPANIIEVGGKRINFIVCGLILVVIVLITNFLIASFVVKIIILSVLGLMLSNFIPRWNFKFVLKSGGVLIILVMAVLGLKLKFASMSFNMLFFGFLIIWLISHLLIMMMMAKWMNINSAWVPIASMANVGGIATAPAVTAAYNKLWMPHAIILAILSMATGTFWGMLTIFLIEMVIN